MDVIWGWRNIIHGWYPQMKMTDGGNGQSHCLYCYFLWLFSNVIHFGVEVIKTLRSILLFFKFMKWIMIFRATLRGKVHYAVASHLPAWSSSRNDKNPPPMTFFHGTNKCSKNTLVFRIYLPIKNNLFGSFCLNKDAYWFMIHWLFYRVMRDPCSKSLVKMAKPHR